jgi:hypothetical protein
VPFATRALAAHVAPLANPPPPASPLIGLPAANGAGAWPGLPARRCSAFFAGVSDISGSTNAAPGVPALLREKSDVEMASDLLAPALSAADAGLSVPAALSPRASSVTSSPKSSVASMRMEALEPRMEPMDAAGSQSPHGESAAGAACGDGDGDASMTGDAPAGGVGYVEVPMCDEDVRAVEQIDFEQNVVFFTGEECATLPHAPPAPARAGASAAGGALGGAPAGLAVFHLPIIYDPVRNSLEEHVNFPLDPGGLIAGRYRIVEPLGAGVFSRAVQCVDLNSNKHVCIKIIRNNKDFFDQSLGEIKLLQHLNAHDPLDAHSILRMLDYFYFKEHLFIGAPTRSARPPRTLARHLSARTPRAAPTAPLRPPPPSLPSRLG